MDKLTLIETVRGRGLGYALLGRLFLAGVTEVTLSQVLAVPELAGALPVPFDGERMAVRYQQVLGFDVFPFEGVFLGEDGLLGGGASEAVGRFYDRVGFPAGQSTSPDHIGHELGLLAFLCGAEADALADGLPEVAERMRGLQAAFLAAHLGRWLAPFVVGLRRQGDVFFGALAGLMWDLVVDHRGDAGVGGVVGGVPAGAFVLTEKTGLKDIARFLTTPASCGLFLSRTAIGQLAQRVGLPRGFGKRWQMMLTLLESAGRYDDWARLLDEIEGIRAGWLVDYGALGAGLTSGWQGRLAGMEGVLGELRVEGVKGEL